MSCPAPLATPVIAHAGGLKYQGVLARTVPWLVPRMTQQKASQKLRRAKGPCLYPALGTCKARSLSVEACELRGARMKLSRAAEQ